MLILCLVNEIDRVVHPLQRVLHLTAYKQELAQIVAVRGGTIVVFNLDELGENALDRLTDLPGPVGAALKGDLQVLESVPSPSGAFLDGTTGALD